MAKESAITFLPITLFHQLQPIARPMLARRTAGPATPRKPDDAEQARFRGVLTTR